MQGGQNTAGKSILVGGAGNLIVCQSAQKTYKRCSQLNDGEGMTLADPCLAGALGGPHTLVLGMGLYPHFPWWELVSRPWL